MALGAELESLTDVSGENPSLLRRVQLLWVLGGSMAVRGDSNVYLWVSEGIGNWEHWKLSKLK